MKKIFVFIFVLLCIVSLPAAASNEISDTSYYGYYFETDNGKVFGRVLNLNGNSVKIVFDNPIISETVKDKNITLERVNELFLEVQRKIDGVTATDISQNSITLNFPSYLKPCAMYRVTIRNIFSYDGEEFENICFYVIPDKLIFCDFEDYTSKEQIIKGIYRAGYDYNYKPMWYDDKKLTFEPYSDNGNNVLCVYDGSFNEDGTTYDCNGVFTSDRLAFGELDDGIIEWSFRFKPLASDGGTLNIRVSNDRMQYAPLLQLIQNDENVKIFTTNSDYEQKGIINISDWAEFKFSFDLKNATYSIAVDDKAYIGDQKLSWNGYYVNSTENYQGEGIYRFDDAKFDILTAAKEEKRAGSPKYLIDDYKIIYIENGKTALVPQDSAAAEFYDYSGKKLLPSDDGIAKIKLLFESYQKAVLASNNIMLLDKEGESVEFSLSLNENLCEIDIFPKNYIEGDYTLKLTGNSIDFKLSEYPPQYAAVTEFFADDNKNVSAVVSNGLYTEQNIMFAIAAYNGKKLVDVKTQWISIEPLCADKKVTMSFSENNFGTYDALKCFAVSQALTPKDLYETGNFSQAKFGENTVLINAQVKHKNDTNPVCVTRNGKSGYMLIPGSDSNFNDLFFNVDDSLFVSLVNDENILVEVDYFDEGYGCFTLFYDGYNTRNSSVNYVNLENTLRWKTAHFILQDGYFRNYFNGCDLKLSLYSDTMNYSEYNVIIGNIKVTKLDTKSKVEIAAVSKNEGNIFKSGENVVFDITFDASKLSGMDLEVSQEKHLDVLYEVYDHKDNIIWTSNDVINLNDLYTAYTNLEFLPDKFGVLFLKISVQNKELGIYSKYTEEFSYSVNAIDNRNDALGACNVTSPYLAATAGFGRADGGIQIDYVYDSQTKSFNLPQDYLDSLSEFEEYKINYMAEIGAKGSADFEFAQDEHSPRSEEGLKLYADYCKYISDKTSIIGDYIGGVFETWNEFDGATNYDKRPYSDYANFLKVAYETIKTDNPNALIVGPTACGDGYNLIKAVLENGAGKYMDACSIHPYNWTTNPKEGKIVDMALSARSLLDEYGFYDTPIWISEVGWADECYGVSTYQQGYYIVELYTLIKANNAADKMFVYRFKDTGNLKGDREKSFGILHNDGKAKPAYVMISAMNNFLADKEFCESINVSDDFNAYKFKNLSNDTVTVCWADKLDKNLIITADSSIKIFDVYGNLINEKSEGGALKHKIGVEPVYIVGDLLNIAAQ